MQGWLGSSAAKGPQALVHASQHVLGHGDEAGTWLVELYRGSGVAAGVPLLLCLQAAIPWYFQAWFHTLTVRIDGETIPLKEVRRHP